MTPSLICALFDPQDRVRLVAQYALRQQGTDVRAVYLATDPTDLPWKRLCGWIAGLASVGQPQDARLVAPFIDHLQPRVRLEVMHTLGTLDLREYRLVLAQGVLDSVPISRASIRALRKGNGFEAGLLEHMLVRADTRALKERVLLLALELGRFAAAELLLRWQGGPGNEGWAFELAEQIDELLIGLMQGFGQTYYTRPSAEVWAALEARAAQLSADHPLVKVLGELAAMDSSNSE